MADSKDFRSRRWCGTHHMTDDPHQFEGWFNPLFADSEVKQWAASLNSKAGLDGLKYFVGQMEICPNTGRRHIQFYVELFNAKGLGGMKLMNVKTHWEPAKGTAAANKVYCHKPGGSQRYVLRTLR